MWALFRAAPTIVLVAFCAAVAYFAIEQQCQPFGVREIAGLFLRFELDESLRHAVELERSELIKGRMGEHQFSPQWK